MNKKKIIKFLITSMILLGVLVFMSTFIRSSVYAPEDEIVPPPELAAIVEKQELLSGHSAKLSIPKINVNAKVQEVGITKKGTMGVPGNFSDVGWYKYGPMPGKAGTALIAGHVDNGLALPGVFKNLDALVLGDDVYVETKEGATLHFIVTKIATYDYNAPTKDIFVGGDIPQLLLITCTGNWVQDIKTHDKRLVVTTVLASDILKNSQETVSVGSF